MKVKKSFAELRSKIDEAIRAGLTQKDFLELHDIQPYHWYKIKPEEFDWQKVQIKLNIPQKKRGPKRKPRPNWDMLEKKVDEAIKNYMTFKQFLEQEKINKNVWYEIKPENFRWDERQRKLGIPSVRSRGKRMKNEKISKDTKQQDNKQQDNKNSTFEEKSIKNLYADVFCELAKKLANDVKKDENNVDIYMNQMMKIGQFMQEIK